jgi:hypothetical protein
VSKLFQQVVDETAAAPSLNRQRSAALVLHGMSPADRAWALAELSVEERNVLLPLIDELQSLGVPADPAWAASALDTAVAASSPEQLDSARRRVAAALPQQVASILEAEPVDLVRRLTAMAAWPWRGEVLALLKARRGDLFEPEPALAPPAATALDRAILARFAQQLDGLYRRPADDAAATSGNGWRAKLRAWGLVR